VNSTEGGGIESHGRSNYFDDLSHQALGRRLSRDNASAAPFCAPGTCRWHAEMEILRIAHNSANVFVDLVFRPLCKIN